MAAKMTAAEPASAARSAGRMESVRAAESPRAGSDRESLSLCIPDRIPAGSQRKPWCAARLPNTIRDSGRCLHIFSVEENGDAIRGFCCVLCGVFPGIREIAAGRNEPFQSRAAGAKHEGTGANRLVGTARIEGASGLDCIQDER